MTLALCAEMLVIGKLAPDAAAARVKLQAALDSGAAAEKFAEAVRAFQSSGYSRLPVWAWTGCAAPMPGGPC